jgi:hypothetical protein
MIQSSSIGPTAYWNITIATAKPAAAGIIHSGGRLSFHATA